MKKYEGFRQSGWFKIGEKELVGDLSLDGRNSQLKLYSKEAFSIQSQPDRSITGTLHDLKRLSLLQCISSGTGSTHTADEDYHTARVFPHYVAFGDEHITASEQKIIRASFIVDDATTLFYDFDAFGSVFKPENFIEQIANANSEITKRQVPTGPDAQILYFSGKREIFKTQTVFGEISAAHNPTHFFEDPKGLRLDNNLRVNVEFNEPLVFKDAIERLMPVIRFLEVIVGRPQNVLELTIKLQVEEREFPKYLDVYWCLPPSRKDRSDKDKPHPGDILLDAVKDPATFSNVLANWLSRHDTWRTARARFTQGFSEQLSYPIDRLVGAANMFDILPPTALPAEVTLPADIEKARQESISIFRKLPNSNERTGMLRDLGMFGKPRLKHKIRHRAKLIVDVVGGYLPDFELVIDEAVKCRNFFVHGGDSQFEYSKNYSAVVFFTDTLEFIFAASDLIEAGWNIEPWYKAGTTMSHPFSTYRISYLENLKRLKDLLPAKVQTQ